MILFSRHVKRRMRLYNLSEKDVISVINTGEKELLSDEKQTFFATLNNSDLPIKVVIKIKDADIIVITAYPLKKGM